MANCALPTANGQANDAHGRAFSSSAGAGPEAATVAGETASRAPFKSVEFDAFRVVRELLEFEYFAAGFKCLGFETFAAAFKSCTRAAFDGGRLLRARITRRILCVGHCAGRLITSRG